MLCSASEKLVSEYAGIPLPAVYDLDIITFWALLRDSVIYNRAQTETGRKWLRNAWRITQTEPETEKLKAKYGEAKEKMHRFQTAQENMNSASVEYVRGMSEIKAFNQTADSFKRLSKSITDYTSFVLEYALGWQNCMPAFTTIINNIYSLGH